MSGSVRLMLLSLTSLLLTLGAVTARGQSQSPTPEPNTTDKIQADLCASKTGDARDKCLKEGQDRQLTSGLRGDVGATSTNSDYNVARAKCDLLTGTKRDDCMAAARSKYKP